MNITLAQAQAAGIDSVLQVGANTPEFLRILNEAQQILCMGPEKWWNLVYWYEINITNGLITWPREIATIEGISACGSPLSIRSQWFQFVSNGYGWSNWEGAFLFESLLALTGLALVAIAGPPEELPLHRAKSIRIAWLLPLAIAIGCFWYLLHWGQLEGWLESPRIRMAAIICAIGMSLALLLAPTGFAEWGKSAPLLAIVVTLFAGFTQYFNVSDMGVYGGLFVNFGVWERALLVWPISCGAATAVIVARYLPRSGGFSLAGLLCIAAGIDRKSTRLNSSHTDISRMPSSA